MTDKKLLTITLSISLTFLPLVTYAISLQQLVCNIQTSLMAMGGGLAAIAFIVAGIMFLTATGNPGRMQIARGSLIAAVIGIIIILLAGTASTFIAGITQLKDVTPC